MSNSYLPSTISSLIRLLWLFFQIRQINKIRIIILELEGYTMYGLKYVNSHAKYIYPITDLKIFEKI